MPSLTVRIVKPEREIATIERASMLLAESVEGQFELLPGHTSFCAVLRTAPMEIRVDRGMIHRFSICGGIIRHLKDRVDVFAKSGEISKEIDVDRADAALKRARGRIESGDEGVDRERAGRALRRAMVRLKVASYRQA